MITFLMIAYHNHAELTRNVPTEKLRKREHVIR